MSSPSWLGQTLGAYRIVRQLGAGAMGEVYEAGHTRLAGKRYAIKIMSPALSGPSLLARFRREAEILARLRHPGIVGVHDYDQTASGAVYLVMDLLEGEDLQFLLGRGALENAEVARLLREIADALDAAHAAGVVHRDLKPANLFIRDDGRAVVLDFGVARDTGDPAALTRPGEIFGTPAYMSPEQATGHGASADARTDVFALAAIAFEMLTGVQAFGGPTTTAILAAIATGPRPDLRAFRPDLDPSVAAGIAAALAIDPGQRTSSVRELAAAVAAPLEADARPAPELRVEPSPPVGTDPTMPSSEPPATPLALDDNVQFTVYRPRRAAPEIWHQLLAFAHLSDRPLDADPSEPDPIEQVKAQAAQVLGDAAAAYADTTSDSRQAVPREGEISFVPEVTGVTFNPRSRSFLWLESVHRESFRFKAPARMSDTTARGRLTVYLGRIILAEIPLALRIGGGERPAEALPTTPSHARPYRRIFASYSHADAAVVSEIERYAASVGDVYVRDLVEQRAGQIWDPRLEQMIGESDVFQLFWSTNSMRSPLVRAEWEYALSLDRPRFIRPTYWEEPLPQDPAANLPPPELARLRFQKIGWRAPPPVTRPRAIGPQPCGRCGHLVGAGYDFCGQCGAQLAAVTSDRPLDDTIPAKQTSVCDRCGKENQPHYQYCLGCGAELGATATPGAGVGVMKTMMAGPTPGIPGMSPRAPEPMPPTVAGNRPQRNTGAMAAVSGPGPQGPGPQMAGSTYQSPVGLAPRAPRSRGWLLAVALVAIAGLAVLLVLLFG